MGWLIQRVDLVSNPMPSQQQEIENNHDHHTKNINVITNGQHSGHIDLIQYPQHQHLKGGANTMGN